MSTAIDKVTDEITKTVAECSIVAIKEMPALKQAIVLASGIKTLKAALTKEIVETHFMPLQGSKLGFRTDKDKENGYPWDVVRECVIEAMIRGFQPVANEFNIIAGGAYFTKEGFERRVAEYPGLTNLEHHPGVPHLAGDKGALVPYSATWLLNGKPCEMLCDLIKNADGSVTDRRIAVRVNGGMGADAILGKAKRKILARIFERISGLRLSDGDVIDTEGTPVPDEPQKPANKDAVDELVEKHKAKGAAAKASAKPVDAPKSGDPAVDSSGHPEPGAAG